MVGCSSFCRGLQGGELHCTACCETYLKSSFPTWPSPSPTSWQVSHLFLNFTHSPKISLIFFRVFAISQPHNCPQEALPAQSILIQLSRHPPLLHPHVRGDPRERDSYLEDRKRKEDGKTLFDFQTLGGEWIHVCAWLSPIAVHLKPSPHC